MGDMRKDSAGNWWYHVVGKGNKAGKISVRDDYVENYLNRWRLHQGLSPLPGFREITPLNRQALCSACCDGHKIDLLHYEH